MDFLIMIVPFPSLMADPTSLSPSSPIACI